MTQKNLSLLFFSSIVLTSYAADNGKNQSSWWAYDSGMARRDAMLTDIHQERKSLTARFWDVCPAATAACTKVKNDLQTNLWQLADAHSLRLEFMAAHQKVAQSTTSQDIAAVEHEVMMSKNPHYAAQHAPVLYALTANQSPNNKEQIRDYFNKACTSSIVKKDCSAMLNQFIKNYSDWRQTTRPDKYSVRPTTEALAAHAYKKDEQLKAERINLMTAYKQYCPKKNWFNNLFAVDRSCAQITADIANNLKSIAQNAEDEIVHERYGQEQLIAAETKIVPLDLELSGTIQAATVVKYKAQCPQRSLLSLPSTRAFCDDTLREFQEAYMRYHHETKDVSAYGRDKN